MRKSTEKASRYKQGRYFEQHAELQAIAIEWWLDMRYGTYTSTELARPGKAHTFITNCYLK